MPTTIEERVDLEDWDAFQRLDRLTDHWWWRPGWHPDRHYLTWYIVFDNPELRAHVERMQRELADLDYLDPVPANGLHMTVQGVAFADEIDPEQVTEIGARTADRCADLAPFTLTVGPVGGYDGGTFLRAAPWQPVAELRSRLRGAVADILGDGQVPDEPARFKPHVSLTYNHADVPARDLIQRVGVLRDLPPVTVPVATVDLVELRREHHTYRWDIRHHLDLTSTS